ncbi:MAG: hypothetical protein KDE14_02920, partial [Rhodobacteraceae bacterium]|nr:hypothetical protein [Paracoccaceae bacterium]
MLMYRATAMQIKCVPVNTCPDKDAARALMAKCLDKLEFTVPGIKHSTGPSVKLVVLPEYFMTGFPMGMAIDKWADWAAVDVDGPEYTRLAKIAQTAGVFLCGNAYVRDKNFPGIFFQGCFIFFFFFELVLHYQLLTSMFSPTLHDYLDKYLYLY